jgi:glutamate-ammonia-ligase adenylyltransferase
MRQLAQYFESGAQSWEALVYGKLRYVAGDRRLAVAAGEQLHGLRRRFAAAPQFTAELRTMRKRISDSGAVQSFKSGVGGLYDLDFILGYLEARGDLLAAGHPLDERLGVLRNRGLLSEGQARQLVRAGALFRRVEHSLRVVEGRPRKWLPESDELRRGVEHLAGRAELDGVLQEEMRAVRIIFDSILGD